MDQHGHQMSRAQLLSWLGKITNIYIAKLQELSSGAIYCQVLDLIFPNSVPMGRVNWKAKYDYQFIANMKLIQLSLDKAGINKKIEIEKLAKGKVQENMEFIQWLKKQFDSNCTEERLAQYNPEARRGDHQIDLSYADKKIVPKKFQPSSPRNQHQKEKSPNQLGKSPARLKSPAKLKSPGKAKKVQSKEGDSKKTTEAKISKTNSNNNSQQSNLVESHFKQRTCPDESNYHDQENMKQMEEELKYYKNEATTFKQIAKYSQMKLQTVKKILEGKDSDQMKIGLISDILEDIVVQK